jgi:hypothetical protein
MSWIDEQNLLLKIMVLFYTCNSTRSTLCILPAIDMLKKKLSRQEDEGFTSSFKLFKFISHVRFNLWSGSRMELYLEDWSLHATSLEVAPGVSGREVHMLLSKQKKGNLVTCYVR